MTTRSFLSLLAASVFILLATASQSRAAATCSSIFAETTNLAEAAVSETEDLVHKGDMDYLVWTKGARAGEVFRALPRFSKAARSKVMPADEFVEVISDRIVAMRDRILQEQPQRKDMPDNGMIGPKPSIDEFRSLVEFIVYHYYGNSKVPGFETMQYYSPSHAKLLQSMRGGIDSVKKDGILAWLGVLARSRGVRQIDMAINQNLRMDFEKIFLQIMKGKEEIPETESYGFPMLTYDSKSKDYYFDSEDPIRLTHTTYGSSLSGILNSGAIQSARRSTDTFAKPTTGEMTNMQFGDNRLAWHENSVSFWTIFDGKPISIGRPWQAKDSLDYVMMFGVGNSKFSEIKKDRFEHAGRGMMGETQIKDSLSLNEVTHVFVPYFKIAEVSYLLEIHGYKNIKVLPLSFEESRPLIPAKLSQLKKSH